MSFEFEIGTVILIILVTLFAALIQSASGVAYACLFMMFMPSIIGYSSSLAMANVCYSVLLIVTVIYTFKYVDVKKCLKIAVPCLITNAIGMVIGTLCVKAIEGTNTKILTLLLGVALTLISLYFFTISNKVKIKPTIPKGLALGGMGGLMCGFFGMGGPPISIYILNATDSANEYLGAIQIPYLAGVVSSVTTHALSGSLTPPVLGAAVISIVPTIVGTFGGIWLANKVDNLMLKRIVYAVMMVMGIVLIVQNI